MSTIKVDTVRPVTTDGSLSLKGDSGGSATTNGISVDSSGNTSITGTTTIATADINGGAIDGTTIGGTTPAAGSFTTINGATIDGYATTSEVQGTHTTGSITSGTTALTVASGTGISTGDYIVGEGITPGTTVSAISGTSVTLSANANATLSSDPVSFYTSTKLLSPGLVAGQLCRAWVNFDGTGTVSIRASGNVSSISDDGAGQYRVNFTTAMPDANYSHHIATAGNSDNANTFHSNTTTNSYAQTSSYAVVCTKFNGNPYDNSVIHSAIFR